MGIQPKEVSCFTISSSLECSTMMEPLTKRVRRILLQLGRWKTQSGFSNPEAKRNLTFCGRMELSDPVQHRVKFLAMLQSLLEMPFMVVRNWLNSKQWVWHTTPELGVDCWAWKTPDQTISRLVEKLRNYP